MSNNICLGTAQFGFKYGVANSTGVPTDSEVRKILDFCILNDILFIDTAQAYGNSEVRLGSLSPTPNSFKFVSKLAPSDSKRSKNEIILSLIESTNRLKTPKMFGFMAHRSEQLKDQNILNAFQDLKYSGLIDHYGASVYTPVDAIKVINTKGVSIVQIPMNIIDRRWLDLNIFELAAEKNVKIFIRSIFLQGLFFLSKDELIIKNMKWATKEMESFNELLNSTRLSIEQLTFSLLSSLPGNPIIIMGLENINQLKSNLTTWESIYTINYNSQTWWDNLPNFSKRILNPSLW